VRPSLELVASTPDASVACNPRREPSFGFDWHYHPEVELTLIRSGSGRRFVGDAVHDYGPGDLVLIGGGTPHTWESTSAGRHEALVLQFRHEGLLELPELYPVRRLVDAASVGLAFAGPGAGEVAERVMALREGPPARRLIGLLDVLVALCDVPHQTLASRTLVEADNPTARARVQRVIAYVERFHADIVSAAEAARLVAMTPNAFSRFFRRSTGRTFGEYVTDFRLARARRALIDDDTPVSTIAAESGFANLSNFNRRFRAKTGMSPREFRRRFRPPGEQRS
jgi:AraC-like DNA-binding protein